VPVCRKFALGFLQEATTRSYVKLATITPPSQLGMVCTLLTVILADILTCASIPHSTTRHHVKHCA
jgi:hypothetical protein